MNDKRFDRNLFRHARISTLLLLAEWYLMIMAELRRPEGPPSGSPYSYRKGNPGVDFLMFIMGSDIARGRVRTTATTPENSVNIWNLLWLSRRLIISTEKPVISISTFPNALSSKRAQNHEKSIYFSTNSIVGLCHAPT